MTSRMPHGRIGPIILGALLIMLLVLAALTAQLGGSNGSQTGYPTYSVHSSGPGGTRALSLWLAANGYQTRTLEYQPFRLNQQDKLLFMLFPSSDPTDQQASSILDWVRRGGTLVFATGEPSGLLTQLGLVVSPNAAKKTNITPVEPSLDDPPVVDVTVNTYATLNWRDPSWIPVLDDLSTGKIVAATRIVGQGTVLALTTGDIFSNSGLAQPGNRNLTLNILSRVPSGSAVAIDEYHHGFTEQGTLTNQLVRQPWGWAILYLAAATFVFIAMNGRRFGHTIRPYAHALRRSRSEFASTLASMLHQNRHRDWLREHYVNQLKRSLGTRFRVQSNLPAVAFVEELARRRPEASALSEPLIRLEAGHAPDEGHLVALIRESEIVSAPLLERAAPRDPDVKSMVQQDDKTYETNPVVRKMKI